jgi:hypothetical protein
MSDLISFMPAYQSLLLIGGATAVLFALVDFIWLFSLRKSGKPNPKNIVLFPVVIAEVVLIVVAGVVGGSMLNEHVNQQRLADALHEKKLDISSSQLDKLKSGNPVVVGKDTVVLVPLDNSGLKYELNAAPTKASDNQESLDEILTPGSDN